MKREQQADIDIKDNKSNEIFCTVKFLETTTSLIHKKKSWNAGFMD